MPHASKDTGNMARAPLRAWDGDAVVPSRVACQASSELMSRATPESADMMSELGCMASGQRQCPAVCGGDFNALARRAELVSRSTVSLR